MADWRHQKALQRVMNKQLSTPASAPDVPLYARPPQVAALVGNPKPAYQPFAERPRHGLPIPQQAPSIAYGQGRPEDANPKPAYQPFAERPVHRLPIPVLEQRPAPSSSYGHGRQEESSAQGFQRFAERPPLHGLPIRESEEYLGPFNPYGLGGPEDSSSRGSKPVPSVHGFFHRPSDGPVELAIMDLTTRIERMEKRADEAEQHRIRLETKVDQAEQHRIRMEAKIDEAEAARARMEATINDDDETLLHNTRNIHDVASQVKRMKRSLAASAHPGAAGPIIWAPGILNTPTGSHPWTRGHAIYKEAEVDQTAAGPLQATPAAQNKRAAPWNESQTIAQEALKRVKITQQDMAGGRQEEPDAESPATDQGWHTPARAGPSPFQSRPQPTPQTGTQPQGSGAPPVVKAAAMAPGGDELVWGFLDFIKRMDCSSTEDMLHLNKYVEGRESFELPLFSSTNSSSVRMDYLLKVGGILSTRLSASPNPPNPDEPEQDQTQAEQDEVLERRILEIALDEGRANALPKHELEKLAPPSYLVPLGEIYVANRSSTSNWQEVTSTNFFVLMDVTTPRKAIWMVYRYERRFEGDNGPVWKPVPSQGREKFLKSGIPRFDTLCLLDNVDQWRSPDVDMVTMDRFAEALPGRGHKFLQPVFSIPVLAALNGVLRDGWTA